MVAGRIEAGKLDRRLGLLRATVGRNALKGKSETWGEPFAEVWASYTPLRDAERMAAAQAGSAIDVRFVIRWSPDVADLNTKDRCVCEDVTYSITGVKPIGRREGLEVSAAALSDTDDGDDG